MYRFPDWITSGHDLTQLNTFGVPSSARYFAAISDDKKLEELIATGFAGQMAHLVVGRGSNLLFVKPFDGLVIHAQQRNIMAEPLDDEQMLLTCGAGAGWHELVEHCVANNWGGIENLALIPGTVGAAPVQNIGAYGSEVADVLEYVDGIDLHTGTRRRLNRKECQFGYRDSIFKHDSGKNFFISSVTLRLTRNRHRINTGYQALQMHLQQLSIVHPGIREVFDAVVAIRRSKLPDPAVTGNAGSFFKNPIVPMEKLEEWQLTHPSVPFYPIDNQNVKVPAGWLIETAGWKGRTIGRVGTHAKQALVIVNLGGASGQEIYDFSQRICDDVRLRFGIELEREVQLVNGA